MSELTKSFDGARIAYRVYGQGDPTVLLSNGIGCNQAYVDHVVRALAGRYRTIVWDYRGHVDSEPPSDPREYDLDQILRDMDAVVEAAGIGDVVLAGFSMGVQVSLEYYHRHPGRVRGFLMLLGTYEYPLRSFFYLGRAAEPFIRAALSLVRLRPPLFQKAWSTILSGPWVYQFARLFVLNAGAARREDFESWREHLARFDMHTFLQLAVHLGAHSAGHVLPEVDVPTLIVAGDKDNFNPIRNCRRMHEQIPGSEWFPVAGGSHGGLFEFPEIINPRVLAFMDRHFGS
jgi:pimeloyl-ACP methyl ester carboxylesterase